jgi:predicted transposase/invertase (TIGR01784 family)
MRLRRYFASIMFFNMEPLQIQNAHDHFFRESMVRIELAKRLLFAFVKVLILKNIDFSTFEIYKGDWIDEKLKESRSDILYRAKLLSQNEYFYFLFEHKSSPDKNTPYQIHRYMHQIWDEHKKQNPFARKLPVVLSIIVYHGKDTWNISNSIKPLFAIIEGAEEYIPDFRSEVIDLSRLNDEMLGDQIELKAFLIALKYSRSPDIFKILPEIIRLLNSESEKNDDYLKVVLLYIGSVIEKSARCEFFEIIRLKHKNGVSYMETIADALREEGRKQERERIQIDADALRKEGEIKGEIKIILEMLADGMSVEKIHKITNFTKEQIEEIQKHGGLSG